ncbi:MAG: PDZ domain-containing protein [Hyphomonadaceae bacterium]|nr:PDZ domain-containing protein [Hyphomonadaceae bacterium]
MLQPASAPALQARDRCWRGRIARLCAAFVVAAALAAPTVLLAQEAPRPQPEVQGAPQGASTTEEFGRLFDAVVATTAKNFWDKERLSTVGWEKRAAEARPSVIEAPSLEEAARRINALLGELKTSHTGLLTPDDVDYYILMAVFGGASMPQAEFDDRFWGAGVTYAGIGHFSVRIDGRDFVDAVLEGSPAQRAGLKVGDEILTVDGAPYHPVRSFRGRVGHDVAVSVRRTPGGPAETFPIRVMSIAPLHAFREATRASVRVIEREGRRIGYVHVWASVGEESGKALQGALSRLGISERPARSKGDRGESPPAPLDGLIIDMRGKIGGTATTATRYLDLLDPRGPLMGSRDKSQASRAVRGRTAVLIDHHTRSTGELFVHAYKRERQGPLIGTRTAGAVSAARAFAMPGDNLLYVAVSGLEIDGDVLEGPGVAPDIEVARPVPYAQGADPVLDVAVDFLVGRARSRTAPQGDAPSRSN